MPPLFVVCVFKRIILKAAKRKRKRINYKMLKHRKLALNLFSWAISLNLINVRVLCRKNQSRYHWSKRKKKAEINFAQRKSHAFMKKRTARRNYYQNNRTHLLIWRQKRKRQCLRNQIGARHKTDATQRRTNSAEFMHTIYINKMMRFQKNKKK